MLERFRTTRGRYTLFALGGAVVGIVVGIGGVAVVDSTDSPEFCSSCHIMDSAFASFSTSNHGTLDCNDCHAPSSDLLTKLTFKARAGMGHMYMNTIGRGAIPDVLHATSDSTEVVNDNCIKCHEPSLSMVDHDAKERCADCHRAVPHGRGLERPEEWHEPMQVEVAR